MRRILPLICSLVLVILVVAFAVGQVAGRTLAAQSHPLASGPSSYCASWAVMNSPNVSGESNYLAGVSALSDTDVWAVGYSSIPGTEQALIQHFNGTAWSIVANPGPTPLISQLFGVTAISPNNVWAVGFYGNSGQYSQPLIIHWDGTSWSTISNPTFAYGGQLTAIAAVSADDIWVAGDASPSQNTNVGILEHWNGASWVVVPSPNPSNSPDGPALSALAAVGTNDVWAVGSFQNSASVSQTLAMHWDGTAWSIVATPNSPLSSYGDVLNGVTALASNGVWAIGHVTIDPNNSYDDSLIEHWNGSTWSIVSSPNLGISTDLFAASAVPGSQTVWAAGDYYDSTTSAFYPLTVRWDGRTWSIVPTPTSATAQTTQLYGVWARKPADVWTVGTAFVPISNSPHHGRPRVTSSLTTMGFVHNSAQRVGPWHAHPLGALGSFSGSRIGDSLTEQYLPRSSPTGACSK